MRTHILRRMQKDIKHRVHRADSTGAHRRKRELLRSIVPSSVHHTRNLVQLEPTPREGHTLLQDSAVSSRANHSRSSQSCVFNGLRDSHRNHSMYGINLLSSPCVRSMSNPDPLSNTYSTGVAPRLMKSSMYCSYSPNDIMKSSRYDSTSLSRELAKAQARKSKKITCELSSGSGISCTSCTRYDLAMERSDNLHNLCFDRDHRNRFSQLWQSDTSVKSIYTGDLHVHELTNELHTSGGGHKAINDNVLVQSHPNGSMNKNWTLGRPLPKTNHNVVILPPCLYSSHPSVHSRSEVILNVQGKTAVTNTPVISPDGKGRNLIETQLVKMEQINDVPCEPRMREEHSLQNEHRMRHLQMSSHTSSQFSSWSYTYPHGASSNDALAETHYIPLSHASSATRNKQTVHDAKLAQLRSESYDIDVTRSQPQTPGCIENGRVKSSDALTQWRTSREPDLTQTSRNCVARGDFKDTKTFTCRGFSLDQLGKEIAEVVISRRSRRHQEIERVEGTDGLRADARSVLAGLHSYLSSFSGTPYEAVEEFTTGLLACVQSNSSGNTSILSHELPSDFCASFRSRNIVASDESERNGHCNLNNSPEPFLCLASSTNQVPSDLHAPQIFTAWNDVARTRVTGSLTSTPFTDQQHCSPYIYLGSNYCNSDNNGCKIAYSHSGFSSRDELHETMNVDHRSDYSERSSLFAFEPRSSTHRTRSQGLTTYSIHDQVYASNYRQLRPQCSALEGQMMSVKSDHAMSVRSGSPAVSAKHISTVPEHDRREKYALTASREVHAGSVVMRADLPIHIK